MLVDEIFTIQLKNGPVIYLWILYSLWSDMILILAVSMNRIKDPM